MSRKIILIKQELLLFFSSIRRHTRCLSDWSSDVCSSDLVTACPPPLNPVDHSVIQLGRSDLRLKRIDLRFVWKDPHAEHALRRRAATGNGLEPRLEIGRASCRERGWIQEVDGAA